MPGYSSLADLLNVAATAHPDSVALRVDDRTWTYREFAREVDRWAVHLSSHGVEHGSRVALSASNGPTFAAAVFATLRLGAVVVMVSTAWRQTEVEHALALTEPTHILHDGSGATDLAAIADGRVILRTNSPPDDAPIGPIPSERPSLDDLAVMVFSSGTTGLAKAVRHSHRTMLAGTQHWIDTLGLTSDDRLQIATPPFHILGLLNLLAVVAAGASVRLHRRFELDAVLNAVEHDRITIEMAVAPIAIAMASHPDLERFDLSSLRYIMWGATPVTASIAETVTARSGVRFLPAYGASELPVLSVNPVHEPSRWRLDSVGLPPSGVEFRVVDLATGAELAPGDTGELQARSPSQMIGYLPESANDDAFIDGWYRTGDVGWLNAEGWVHITDRLKEMIKVNGFQVAPAEIEAALLGDARVKDCAVFGVPDERTGEGIVAAVVRSSVASVSEDELRDLVASSLASYKRVREVVFVDAVPRLPSGKVLRRELKASYLNTVDAAVPA